MPKTNPLFFAAALALLTGSGSALFWWSQQSNASPPPVDPTAQAQAEDEDTGMTRFETEELMRTIGYTQ